MKKNVFLLVAIFLIAIGNVTGQDIQKFKSFDVIKGLVASEDGRYTNCTFIIKEKKKTDIKVSHLFINDQETKFNTISLGNKTMYIARIPRKMNLLSGTTFDLTITFDNDGGFLLPKTVSSTDDGDPGDGGPGGGGDPTIIIIKYP